MAKELPYFKFEPNQWENGNIQICSRESKGLFIDVCSMYWQRLGELPEKLVIQKLCNGNANALQDLYKEDILHMHDGFIVIKFLDEQLTDRNEVSEKRREAAKERWSKSKESHNNASDMQMHSKSNARREEKSKEKKSKVNDNNIPKPTSSVNSDKEKEEKEDLSKVPEFSVFLNHAKSKISNISEQSVRLKYDSWIENGWKDGNDNKIKNWKSKLTNTVQYLEMDNKSLKQHVSMTRQEVDNLFG